MVLTRTTVERAARHAASRPGIDAIILFGSRVRSDAGPWSDWDLYPEEATMYGEMPGFWNAMPRRSRPEWNANSWTHSFP